MLAVAAGVLLSKPVAAVLAILATLVLLLTVAGTRTVQRHLPDLGRLPLVEDYGFHAHLNVASLASLSPARSTPDESLTLALTNAAKSGRRLHSEAGELNPINLDRLDDLVRRYNGFEAEVADALAVDDDVPAEWRDAWLEDPEWHKRQVYPYTRDGLDRLVRTIGYRLQLIDEMRRDLRRKGRP